MGHPHWIFGEASESGHPLEKWGLLLPSTLRKIHRNLTHESAFVGFTGKSKAPLLADNARNGAPALDFW
jgi:hypothetical protein